eukprot:13020317-Heterocapsa_arctica.AAC.1
MPPTTPSNYHEGLMNRQFIGARSPAATSECRSQDCWKLSMNGDDDLEVEVVELMELVNPSQAHAGS